MSIRDIGSGLPIPSVGPLVQTVANTPARGALPSSTLDDLSPNNTRYTGISRPLARGRGVGQQLLKVIHCPS
jgi:hypothetical protein